MNNVYLNPFIIKSFVTSAKLDANSIDKVKEIVFISNINFCSLYGQTEGYLYNN